MNKLLDKLEEYSVKLSTEPHLSALRNAFVAIVPFLVLGGFTTFIAYVLLVQPFMTSLLGEAAVAELSNLFVRINNAGMTIMSLLILVLIPYYLAVEKKFDRPLQCVAVAVAAFFVVVPFDTVTNLFGTSGIFMSALISITSTELYIKLTRIEKLRFNLGPNVPAGIAESFGSVFYVMITMVIYGVLSWLLKLVSGYELFDLINNLIQIPLVGFTCTLPGMIVYYIICGFLFFIGVHPGVIGFSIVNPLLIAGLSMGTNWNISSNYVWGLIGGEGSTLGLVIAMLIQKRRQEFRGVAKIALPVALFNINEPVIFGLPIAYNLMMLFPFLFVRILNGVIGYALTAIGILPAASVVIDWSMPIIADAFIAFGGNILAVIVEIALIVLDTFIWGFFLKRYMDSLDKAEAMAKAG